MSTYISSTTNAALSKQDALRLLEIIHASLFCTTEKEFKRIIEDVKTMVSIDPAARLRGNMPDHPLEDILLPFEGSARGRTPRATVIFKHIGPHLRRKYSQLSGAGAKKNRAVSLTSREKEILLWVKEGKSTWDISSIHRHQPGHREIPYEEHFPQAQHDQPVSSHRGRLRERIDRPVIAPFHQVRISGRSPQFQLAPLKKELTICLTTRKTTHILALVLSALIVRIPPPWIGYAYKKNLVFTLLFSKCCLPSCRFSLALLRTTR